MGKKTTLERLKEKKLFLQSLEGSYLSFFGKKFSPNFQEKPLSMYTEYLRNDHSFPIIDSIQKIPENSNKA
jgi:hypothetical protein